MAKFQKDLTQGSVARHLLAFSLPFLAANFLQALYNMADMLIVGQFNGVVGTSAVGIGGQVTILVINLISGLAVGGTVMIAQFIGARRKDDVKRTVGTMFTLYGIAGIIITVIMLIANPFVLRLLNTPTEVFDEALAYLNICMGGTVFIFGYNAVSAVLRGMGDSKHPLIFVATAAAVNVVLDIIFVGPLHMGAAGAAWATVIAQAISFIMSVVFLRSRNFIFDFKLKSFRIDREMAGKLFKIGLPVSLQGTLVIGSFMVLTGIANSVAGVIGSNALSIAGKVNSVAILPAIAMQSSVASMAGQNLGAGKPERARKTMFAAIGMTLSISAVLFVLVNLFAENIVTVFIGSSDNGQLDADMIRQCIQQGAVYIRQISWEYLLVAVLFNIVGLAIAAGQTIFSMINGILTALVLRVPAAWLLAVYFDLGLSGLSLAVPIATVGALVVAVIYFLSGAWKKSKVTQMKSALEPS